MATLEELADAWDAIDDDDVEDLFEELGVESGEDAENLFDAVFEEDTDSMEDWLGMAGDI